LLDVGPIPPPSLRCSDGYGFQPRRFIRYKRGGAGACWFRTPGFSGRALHRTPPFHRGERPPPDASAVLVELDQIGWIPPTPVEGRREGLSPAWGREVRLLELNRLCPGPLWGPRYPRPHMGRGLLVRWFVVVFRVFSGFFGGFRGFRGFAG